MMEKKGCRGECTKRARLGSFLIDRVKQTQSDSNSPWYIMPALPQKVYKD